MRPVKGLDRYPADFAINDTKPTYRKMKTANNGSLLVAATVILLSSVSHATLCSSEVAFPLSSEPEVDCSDDPLCLPSIARANCIVLNAVSDTPRDCSSGDSSYISASDYVKRQTGTLNCAAAELCFLYTAPAETSLLCLDAATGDYHDESGGKGNVMAGVYTAADGSVETATDTATSTPKSSVSGVQTTSAPGASVTDDEVTSVMSADDAEATRSVSGSGGVAKSSATAATSQSSGSAEQNVGVMTNRIAKGALGLVAGVPLLVAVL